MLSSECAMLYNRTEYQWRNFPLSKLVEYEGVKRTSERIVKISLLEILEMTKNVDPRYDSKLYFWMSISYPTEHGHVIESPCGKYYEIQTAVILEKINNCKKVGHYKIVIIVIITVILAAGLVFGGPVLFNKLRAKILVQVPVSGVQNYQKKQAKTRI